MLLLVDARQQGAWDPALIPVRGLLVVLGLGLMVGGSWALVSAPTQLFLGLVAGLTLLVLVLILVRERNIDVFEPKVVIFFVFVAAFVIPSVRPLLTGTSEYVEIRYYVLAVLYAMVSFICFMLAYHSWAGLRLAGLLPELPVVWDHRRVIRLVVVFSLIGFVSYYVGMQMVGGVRYYIQNIGYRIQLVQGLGYVFVLRNFAVTANLIWFISIAQRRLRGQRVHNLEALSYAFHLILIIAMLLPLGSRGTILSVILTLLIAWHYGCRKIAFRWLFSFVAVGFFFVYGYAVFRSYSEESLYVRVMDAEKFSAFASGGLADGTRMVAAIVEGVGPAIDYQWGKTYSAALYYPLPRKFFPDKPKTGGDIVTEQIFFRTSGETERLAPTMVGEAYLNFGLFGVVLVSAVFGAVARAAYAYTARRWGNPSVAVVAGMLFIIIYFFPSGEFVNSATDLVKVGITLLAVLLVADTRGRKVRNANC